MEVYLSLAGIALIPVAITAILETLLEKEKIKVSYQLQQVLIGIIFGIAAILATEFGVNFGGAVINVRDAAPLCAGLIFGAPAGIIAGLIGGLERWFAVLWGAGYYTRLACTISTILAGIIAALLRKLLYFDRIPNVQQSLIIGAVVEVIHMLMIFITNTNDVTAAFQYVKACTFPMIIVNTAALAFAVFLALRISHQEEESRRPGREGAVRSLSTQFRRGLIAVVLIGFLATTMLSHALQTQISKENTQKTIYLALEDAKNDVMDQCDERLLHVNRLVVNALAEDPDQDLYLLKVRYNVAEIDIIDENAIVVNSSEYNNIGFNMAKGGRQSGEFLQLLSEGGPEEMVQEFMPTSNDPDLYLKYSGVRMGTGFVQVAFNGLQMSEEISSFLNKVAANRHIGESGSLLVLDRGHGIVSSTNDSIFSGGADVDIQLDPDGNEEYTVYECTINSEPYYYMYTTAENYYVFGVIPRAEADFNKSLTTYLNVFTQTIVSGVLFAMIYIIIKSLVVDKIRTVTGALYKITKGDLDTKVEVDSSREFIWLSAGINQTVDALKRYIAEANARIDSELQYAREIQSSALPSSFPEREEFEIYALMDPAREVGGDFYDFYFVDDRKIVFLVADVSGKGIPASLFMMRAKTLLKTYAENNIAVADIFTNANYQLCDGNDAAMFVTAWMGFLDLSTGELRYANAGHNRPLLRRKDGTFEYLQGPAGFVLAGMEGVVYKEQTITLEPGDEIFLYTDGVVEATDTEGKLYGDDRLKMCLNEHIGEDAKTLCESVKSDVDHFYEGAAQFDDITELSFRFRKYSR